MRKFHLSAAAVILASVSALPARAESPSFNCFEATYPDEYAICSSAKLSRLDNIANAGYEYVRRVYGNQYARSIDLPLLRARRACADVACIKEQQLVAIEKFKSLGAPISAPVEEEVQRKEKELGAQAQGGDPTTGTAQNGDDFPASGTEGTCPFPALLSEKAQTYEKAYAQVMLNELQTNPPTFSDAYRPISTRELVQPMYDYMRTNRWPTAITTALSKFMADPSANLAACFPELAKAQEALQQYFEQQKNAQEALRQRFQQQKNAQAAAPAPGESVGDQELPQTQIAAAAVVLGTIIFPGTLVRDSRIVSVDDATAHLRGNLAGAGTGDANAEDFDVKKDDDCHFQAVQRSSQDLHSP